MKCPDCEEEMRLVDMPCEIFVIPFTKGRFIIWDMNHKDWNCEFCAMEYQNSRQLDLENSIVESIGREVYEEGFRDGQAR